MFTEIIETLRRVREDVDRYASSLDTKFREIMSVLESIDKKLEKIVELLERLCEGGGRGSTCR